VTLPPPPRGEPDGSKLAKPFGMLGGLIEYHGLAQRLGRMAALSLLLAGCAGDDRAPQRWDTGPSAYGRGYGYGYGRPMYREYGPWDYQSTSSAPGPPTWYGCPQESPACYSD
jgi:hypothetical protein